MPRVPLQITTAARAAPRGPKVRLSDVPRGTVHQPGDPGYHGTGWQHGGGTWRGKGTSGEHRKEWAARSKAHNDHPPLTSWKEESAAIDRRTGRMMYGLAGGSAVAGIGGGLALNAFGNRRAKAIKAGRRDHTLMRKSWETSMPFVRRATQHGGVHNVTGLKARPGKWKVRERRFAEWAARPNNAEILVGAGTGGGGAALIAGAQSAEEKTKRASQQRRAQLRRTGATKAPAHDLTGRGSNLSKALYQREDRVSPVRAAGLLAGGVLGVYGFGHSKLVGRQITRGIKLAQVDGNQRAAQALMRAQAARGSIRSGMAPGEAALRRIRAVNQAIDAVPKQIRGEVAIAAGLMLGSRSTPVHRTHYTGVSSPVPSYGRAW